MTMMAVTSPQVEASEAECRAVLHSCDSAVHSLQTTNNLQATIIADQGKEIDILRGQIASDRAWYKNPSIVIPLSLLVGLAGGVYVTRH